MTKQLKYKLKKTLKNAEFVHADLEYHQELSQDALLGFQEAINRLLAELTEEERQLLKDHLDRQPQPVAPARSVDSEEEEPEVPDYDDISALVTTDIEAEAEEHALPKINKDLELKKLFRRIAEQTHPDKVRANGFSEKEIARLRCIFMRAREAHDNENWYILYSIAIQLGLEIEEPTAEEIDWIEEDIKKTLAAIAGIANLSAWHWYIGNEEDKKQVLRYYFLQAYNFHHPSL
jgi:hypothetical protein